MAEYLKLHPDMVHELMVPSSFMQRPLGRYERYLSGTQMLSTQKSTAQKPNGIGKSSMRYFLAGSKWFTCQLKL